MRYLLADKGYDADRLRRSLRYAGAVPVIPGRQNRKRIIRYDKDRYRGSHLIANAFCRLKSLPRRRRGTSAVSLHVITTSPPPSCQALPSQPRSHSGSDRVSALIITSRSALQSDQ